MVMDEMKVAMGNCAEEQIISNNVRRADIHAHERDRTEIEPRGLGTALHAKRGRLRVV